MKANQPKEKADSVATMLADPEFPVEERRKFLQMIVQSNDESALNAVIEGLEGKKGGDVYAKRIKKLEAIMKELEEGPQRPAMFIAMTPAADERIQYAQVMLDDGNQAYSVVPDPELAKSLKLGDPIVMDGRGRAILRRGAHNLGIGEEAKLERVIDERRVEVSMRGQERFVFFASSKIADQLKNDELEAGSMLVVNPRQFMVFDSIPKVDGLSHFQYLERRPVSKVVVDRDIGDPPPIIEKITQFVRAEMIAPEVQRRYQLNRCLTTLLDGVPGSGKTLAIAGIERKIYEVMSEVTDVPIDELPPRVFRLQMSRILNMYLGESDRNLERFFTEVEQMAAEPFVCPDGREIQLPVIAVLEEIDGLARHRGQDSIHDRILTTALQNLDTARPELKENLIIYLGTTNEIQQVDGAFLRRIGATVERFGRLKRSGFEAVLEKQIDGLPIIPLNGSRDPKTIEKATINAITSWLYSPNGSDKGLVELTFTGSSNPEIRYRRDFVTGALVNRAVQQASIEASQAEHRGTEECGISCELLVREIDRQIRTLADQLTEYNAHKYVDVPDATRVASVRRLHQPHHFPLQLQAH
tara:strand:+ start:3189 stop:4943 length:1755 start_codon:yes stop_codon:yes gene_type:complete